MSPKKRIVLFSLCAIIGCGLVVAFSFYFSEYRGRKYKIESLEIEKNDLTAQNTDLVLEKNDLEDRLESLQTFSETLRQQAEVSQAMEQLAKSMMTFFADKLDQVDAILLKTDKNSLELINWLIANAKFTTYDGILEQANYRYGRWQATQTETDREYLELKSDIENYLSELIKLGEQLDSTDSRTAY